MIIFSLAVSQNRHLENNPTPVFLFVDSVNQTASPVIPMSVLSLDLAA